MYIYERNRETVKVLKHDLSFIFVGNSLKINVIDIITIQKEKNAVSVVSFVLLIIITSTAGGNRLNTYLFLRFSNLLIFEFHLVKIFYLIDIIFYLKRLEQELYAIRQMTSSHPISYPLIIFGVFFFY